MSTDWPRVTFFVVGGFQLLANLAMLARGVARLPAELAAQGATARIADLLRTSWVYGALGNACVSVVLLLAATALRTGGRLAAHVAWAVGGYYLLVGVGMYAFAPERHAGLLVFSALGVAVLLAVAAGP
jgi:hypothetical protein